MTDPRIAVLAEALPGIPTVKALTRMGRFNQAWWDRFAAEILAALPGWMLVESDATVAVLLRRSETAEAEIIRLREANERLMRALRISDHKPHDQAGGPDEGFPVCSVCGAIQTDLAPKEPG